MEKKKSKFYTRHVIEKELRHHVIEWSAVAFGVIGAILNSQLNILGFYLFGIGNILWITFSIKHKHFGLLAMNTIFFMLNVYGIYVWNARGIY